MECRKSSRLASRASTKRQGKSAQPDDCHLSGLGKAKSRGRDDLRPANAPWSLREKEEIIPALKKYGTKDVASIARVVANREEQGIRSFIEKQKRNMMTLQREVATDAIPGMTKLVSEERQLDTPIELWITAAESQIRSKKKSTPVVLPKLLEWIAEYESHPEPKTCGGVDYAAIYRSLALAMQGEVPPEMNAATCRRFLDLFAMLQTKYKESRDVVKSQSEYLAACPSLRVLGHVGSEGNDPMFSTYYSDVRVNPFELPKEFASSLAVRRVSQKPPLVLLKNSSTDVSQ